MSLKICMKARSVAPLGLALASVVALSGCSLFHHSQRPAAGPAPVAAAETGPTAPSEPQTVTEALGDLPAAADAGPGATTVIADAGPLLRTEAPKSYVVQRGDTLWGISTMFLRDPWLWPEIWYVNPQIQNPHLIYPGDSIRLARGSDGQTALQVVPGPTRAPDLYGARLEPMVRGSSLEAPIPTIPYSLIAAFLSHPGVLTRNEVRAAPYVVALPDDHQVAGAGHDLYVRKLAGENGARYSVMHVDEPLKDPDSGRSLGYLAIYTGTAQLVRPGDIAKATLTDSARETLEGDVLIAADTAPSMDLLPHPPARPVSAQIIAVVDNVLLAGQWEVVALNRGSSDGLERGNVLTVEQAGARVVDRCARIEGSSTCWHHSGVTLPREISGTMLVFKTYEHMSYALIIGATEPMQVLDHVRNP